jgi:hypothetical protein
MLHTTHLITRITFGQEYRSLTSSLCSFLHFPVTLSLLGPNSFAEQPILPQSTFLAQCERPCFTPTQSNRQNYNSVYLNLYIFYSK